MTKIARNIKRVLRRGEREQRVQAGKPSARLDYQCPLCEQWFSTYRGRHVVHQAHCKKKQARETVTRVERNRAIHPSLLNDFASKSLIPTPEPLVPRSPTPVPSVPSDTERDQQILEDSIPGITHQRLEDIFRPPSIAPNGLPVLDEVAALPAGESDLSESDMLNRHRVRWGLLTARYR